MTGAKAGLRIALCQMNATVGDLAGNAELILAGTVAAKDAGAQLVLFPELALTGYPPEDLLLREHFLSDTGAHLRELAAAAQGIVAIVGFPERMEAHPPARRGRVGRSSGSPGPVATVLYNAAAVLAEGSVQAIYRKLHLPNYGVFDEQRYFEPGDPRGLTVQVAGMSVGVTVCEDLWVAGAPATTEASAGAKLIVNISASPYHAGKGLERESLFSERARETGAYVAFCAMVGGQDELVFDGHSFVLDPTGTTIARASQFEQDLLMCEIPVPGSAIVGDATPRAPIASVEQEVYAALLLGLRDYVKKNGFGAVVLGLSGGIDSALVACLAVDALGAERVHVAIMPSPHSSRETQDDARALAAALGVSTHELLIEQAMDVYENTLAADFQGTTADLTEENLQARIRGNLLMALSNKFGWLVLATGNKSEMSVGYTTLYGDLAGGFAVIKDVPKTLVYRLARWRNSRAATPAGGERSAAAGASGDRAAAPIPPSIIERAPSAELRAGQVDEDSLPPYDVLDRILHGYVELDRSREQLIAEGLPAADVQRATRLVDLAEYKRRQAPPGIKITERAFGRDRRMPITNAYRA
ncbi:MAG TPA: NAD+ synthase [Solirubrobacteraceae bacterium]|nr:NAD+ synthase [Solirubrobacteraceae bacterium]